MLYTTTVLVFVICPWPATGIYFFSFFPWSKDMPSEEYKRHVQLRLVKKDWMPEGASTPRDGGVLDSYPGSVNDAYNVFRSASLYEFDFRTLDNPDDLLTSQLGYNSALDTIVVIHTISGNAENYFIKNTVAALAMRNFVKNYNVFTVNMPEMQQSMEQTVVRTVYGMDSNYFGLGETIGGFFVKAIKDQLMTAKQINLIGFCYSSQLSGYIARHIYRNTGDKIHTILALDPYSLGFSSIRHEVLSADDAHIVHAYHTNSLVFGSTFRRATADFDLNNGNFQPGCYLSSNYMCSHRRSVLVLWYVILFKDLFQARSCKYFPLFLTCGCKNNPIVGLSYPPQDNAQGQYFLRTESHRPYGYGVEGADCHVKEADKAINSVLDFDFAKSDKF